MENSSLLVLPDDRIRYTVPHSNFELSILIACLVVILLNFDHNHSGLLQSYLLSIIESGCLFLFG